MTRSQHHWLLSICFVLTTALLGADLTTYFSYSQEDLKQLETLKATCLMSTKALENSDAFIAKAIKDENSSSLKALRFYTYLYVAQSEANILSSHLKKTPSGSLDPVTYSVLALFFPESEKPAESCEDPFSVELANVILNKIKERIDKEDSQPEKYVVPKDKESIYVVGLGFTKLLPWIANPPTDFFPPPPSTSEAFWQQQIQTLKGIQNPLTDEKKKVIKFWAEDADWRTMANTFLYSHDIPLSDIIKIRSALMMGIYDSSIIGFDAKYQFLRMRPQVFDPSVHYEIPVPKHPSYPANHALISWTSATILSHYLPAEKANWERLADESGTSRIWAGIHYPIDIEAGKEIGIKIGNAVLSKSR